MKRRIVVNGAGAAEAHVDYSDTRVHERVIDEHPVETSHDLGVGPAPGTIQYFYTIELRFRRDANHIDRVIAGSHRARNVCAMALIVEARAAECAERVNRKPKVRVPQINSGVNDGDTNAVAIREAGRYADARDTGRYNLSRSTAAATTGLAAGSRVLSDILLRRHQPIGNDSHH